MGLGSMTMYALPKYTILNDLLYEYLVNIQFTDTVNIIIDLKQLYRKVFNNRFELEEPYTNEYVISECERISSEALGVISHYRKYFASKKRFTNFYILYSKEECEELVNTDANYKKNYYEYYINDRTVKTQIIRTIDKTLDAICKKLPHVNKIETSDFDELAYANYLCSYLPKNQLMIILSNDEQMYKLCSDNVICLNLKGNSTELITQRNVFKQLGCTNEPVFMNGKLLSLLLAVKGDDRYSLSGIPGYSYKKAYKFLRELVDKGKIRQEEYLIFPIAKEDITDEIILSNYSTILNNFNLMNRAECTERNKIKISEKCAMPKKLINIGYFQELAERFFTMYEIDIAGLLMGELK